jgi:hypothetical protein
MGSALNTQPIARFAKHGSTGVPADCAYVRDNFFAEGNFVADGNVANVRGTIDGTRSVQRIPATPPATGTVLALNTYQAPSDALKVSYFLRDAEGGREFGNSATHIAGFLTGPAITNQQFGLFSGDLLGFDYPDLNGGVPGAERGNFVGLRSLLGSSSVINDWSANADLNVGTDWVITFPGQYTMLNLPQYFLSLQNNAIPCNRASAVPANISTLTPFEQLVNGACDFRDIPAVATFDVYDREEQQLSDPEGELVVSPSLPGAIVRTTLPFEVNVVEWGVDPVLGSANSPVSVAVPGAFGWAELDVDSVDANLAICDATVGGLNLADQDDIGAAITTYCAGSTAVAPNQIPKIGFVAWERSFPGNPDANYGRIVEHSYGS